MGGSRAAVFLSFLVLQPGMLFLTSHLTPHTPPQPTFLFPPLLLIAHTARRSAFPAPAYYHRGGYDTLFCFCFFFFLFFSFFSTFLSSLSLLFAHVHCILSLLRKCSFCSVVRTYLYLFYIFVVSF